MASEHPASIEPPVPLSPAPGAAAARDAIRPIGLPRPASSLIGREREIAAAASAFERGARLLTLTGPGGAGKSRLALAIAAGIAADDPDGVLFVPLAAVRDAAGIARALAAALDLPTPIDRPLFDVVRDELRDRPLLLLLDNLEQVAFPAAALTTLLASCPRLRLLLTSRVPLHLSGEVVFSVPLLPVPADGVSDPRELTANPAARLFAERAAAVRPGFTLDAGNAAMVAAICRRLDGLPLAIELAAARLGVLSLAELRRRLDRDPRLLSGGPIDAPGRLRSLRDAIGWSYDLLSLDDQRLFRALSIFAGSFSLAAAERVAGGDILDGLARLIEAGLLQRIETPDGDSRFTMLATVRECAAGWLAAAGETAAVADRLVAWGLDQAAEAEVTIRGAGQRAWFAFFDLEHESFKTAIAHALDHGQAGVAIRLITGPLWYFWSMRGWVRDERPWLERALAMAEAAPDAIDAATLARAHFADGLFLLQTGDYPRARERFKRALALNRALGDAGRAAGAVILSNLATMDNDQGDYGRARARLEECLAIRRELGLTGAIGSTLVNLGNVANLQGDHETAIRHLDEALGLLHRAGDQRAAAYCLLNLGEAAAGLGQDARARIWFERGLAGLREIGDPIGEGMAAVDLAGVALRSGDLPRAATAALQALSIPREIETPVVIADGLEVAAEIALAARRATLAPRLLAAAAAVRAAARITATPPARRRQERATSAARAALGRDVFDAALVEGRAMPLDAAIAAARAMLSGAATLERVAAMSTRSEPGAAFSARQRDVLRLLVEGRTDREIAAALGISNRTVETHVAGILNKLGVHTRTAAVAHAVRHRLV